MTTADLTSQIAAMNRVLADATTECPECEGTCISLGTICDLGCLGTGRVARFPGFRQECPHCIGDVGHAWVEDVSYQPFTKRRSSSCFCDGTGWQVRAGGLHDALAGLNTLDAIDVFRNFNQWVWTMDDGPMPSAPEILARSLELVIEGL